MFQSSNALGLTSFVKKYRFFCCANLLIGKYEIVFHGFCSPKLVILLRTLFLNAHILVFFSSFVVCFVIMFLNS